MESENVWRYLSRAYLDLQQLRVACQARLRKMQEQKVPEDVQALMKDYYLTLKEEEKDFLARITDRLKDNPLYEWTSRVKGMGPVACLIFLGFIDPQKASTAGKAKAYFGCVPGSGLKSGKRSKFNPLAKGRAWLITRNVIMARDEYYAPKYRQKKEYYMENARKVFLNGEWVTWPPFKDIIEDPTCCPKYHDCAKKLKGKAERLKRKQKKLPCRLHCDQMAKRWLMGILISHAAELMREAAGLDTTNYKSHHSYIAPKPEL